jgi:hypothetical protein
LAGVSSFSQALPIYEQKLIIEGVAYVLSGSTEADVVSGAIKRLRLPFATRLAAAINSTDAGTVRTIITCLGEKSLFAFSYVFILPSMPSPFELSFAF